MKRVLAFLLVLILGSFLVLSNVLALDLPNPTGYVNDGAGMLSADFRQELETNLSEFEKETEAEIAIATVENLQGTTVEDFAVQLFEKWGIGKTDEDNGLLLLIAQEERKMRIEVGYGLEPLITDGRAGRIIRDQMTPAFKEEDYDQGVSLAVAQIQEYIRSGEPPVVEEETEDGSNNGLSLVVFGFFLLTYVSSFWGRTKRTWPGGVVGGLLGIFLGLIIGGFLATILTALGFTLFGSFLDRTLSRNYKKLKKRGKPTGFFFSRGGFFSGGKGGSSGGGFGGFSGGSSGGGGASGGW